MADEDVHRSKCPLNLLGLEQEIGEGERLRRFAKSRLIHRIAIKTSGGERLAETKQHFFRGEVSMSQERNGMRTRRCGEKSNRGCVCSQHYFFDADARLDYARKYGPKNQGGDGCGNEPTVGSSIHYFFSGYFKIIPLDFPSSWRRTDSARLSMKRLSSWAGRLKV